MRFLIVNAYTISEKNNKIFQEFKDMVIKFVHHQKEVVDTDCEFFCRDRNSVEEFLYEPENSLIKLESGFKFDALDMIFIAGSCNVRPWTQSLRKVITLIRMCIKTKKLLFTTSFGAQAFAYLCASNINSYMNVTNNHGEGCKLVEFPKFTMQALKNGHDDYFLDSTTGDLYLYNKITDEWIPKANVGIHSRRDAAEYQSIGKYIIKSPTYRPKISKMLRQFQNPDSGEIICQVKKPFYHHWAFVNTGPEFVVSLFNNWDIHTFTFVNPDKVFKVYNQKFTVLAENNQQGPLILENDNIFCVCFEVQQNHKETVQILSNFVDNGLKQIKFQPNYNTISICNDKHFNQNKGIQNIEIIFNHQQPDKINGNPEELFKKQQKAFMLEQRKLLNAKFQETERDQIFHVGFSVKKSRLPDYVQQNNIADKNYKISRRRSFITKKDQLLRQSVQTETMENYQQHFLTEAQLQSILDSNAPLKPQTPSGKSKKSEFRLRSNKSSNSSKRVITIPKFQAETPVDEEAKQHIIIPIQSLNQQQIRILLHPNLDEEYLGQKQQWIPGYLKDRLKSKKTTAGQSSTNRQTIESMSSR